MFIIRPDKKKDKAHHPYLYHNLEWCFKMTFHGDAGDLFGSSGPLGSPSLGQDLMAPGEFHMTGLMNSCFPSFPRVLCQSFSPHVAAGMKEKVWVGWVWHRPFFNNIPIFMIRAVKPSSIFPVQIPPVFRSCWRFPFGMVFSSEDKDNLVYS